MCGKEINRLFLSVCKIQKIRLFSLRTKSRTQTFSVTGDFRGNTHTVAEKKWWRLGCILQTGTPHRSTTYARVFLVCTKSQKELRIIMRSPKIFVRYIIQMILTGRVFCLSCSFPFLFFFLSKPL